MMGEWKHGLINWPSLKTWLFQAVNNERRQDPHSPPSAAGLLEQNAATPNDQCVLFDESLRPGSGFLGRKCSRILCAAKRFNRAHIAFRLPGYANERAKIEECGVEVTCVGCWEKTRCMLPKRFPAGVGIDGFAKIEKPRQHASGVGFNDRNRLIKGKAGHCMRGVFPDSGKLSHLLNSPWEVSAMPIHNRFCCGMEISRASVVAKALPRPKDLVFGSLRKRGEIGKPVEPLVIIRDHGDDLRLLEHELGNQDCVRIADSAPGEIAPMPTIPTQQATTKFGRLESHRCTQTNTDSSSWTTELVLTVFHLC
jgi:hypothetical protein